MQGKCKNAYKGFAPNKIIIVTIFSTLTLIMTLNVTYPVFAYEEQQSAENEESIEQNSEVGGEDENQSEYENEDLNSGMDGRSVDTEAPTIDLSTLTVSTKEATVGDKVVISFKVEDESRIDAVSLHLTRPVSGQDDGFNRCTYNNETGYYEYVKIIDENTQSGVWKIGQIYVGDQFQNVKSIFAEKVDFSAADFTVVGTDVDAEASVIDLNLPTIQSFWLITRQKGNYFLTKRLPLGAAFCMEVVTKSAEIQADFAEHIDSGIFNDKII